MFYTWKTGDQSSDTKIVTRSRIKGVSDLFRCSSNGAAKSRSSIRYPTAYYDRQALLAVIGKSCFTLAATLIDGLQRFIGSSARHSTAAPPPIALTFCTATETQPTTLSATCAGGRTKKTSGKPSRTAASEAASATRKPGSPTTMFDPSAVCMGKALPINPLLRSSASTGTTSRSSFFALGALSLALSACQTSGSIPPPADDLKAAVEPKPVPGEDIATSDQANADYSASVEAWGDRISAAGGRICRWSERVYKIRIGCPK
jgi:hypothetical protein